MPEKYKLHLSRAALFGAMPLVSFMGTYERGFDEKELLKAFKMLSAKEPLVSSFIETEGENAFVVTGEKALEPKFLSVADETEFFLERKNGVTDVFSHLFRFYILNGKTLAIFASSAVADVKSLFKLSKELLSFYEKRTVNVSPEKVYLYSGNPEIPSNVFSVVTDKIASDIEMKWQKKPQSFNKNDYLRLLKAQGEQKKNSIYISYTLEKHETASLMSACNGKKTDLSSLACYAFKKALINSTGFKKLKRKKVYVGADLRLYEEVPSDFGVGPFFSRVSLVNSPRKEVKANGELKAFHDNSYKKLTNAFYAYYDKMFLTGVSPSLCDCAEFYCAGLLKNKTAKKLAKNYTELYSPILNFDFFNLDCEVWQELSAFENMRFYEQKNKNVYFAVTAVLKDGALCFNIEADGDFCTKACAEKASENALKIMRDTLG